MAPHRLFVAIRPPLEVRAHLSSIMGGIAGARWRSDGQLHCTLRFVGEVDHHVAEDVAIALGRIRHPPIDLGLPIWACEVGCFDHAGRIDTLCFAGWA